MRKMRKERIYISRTTSINKIRSIFFNMGLFIENENKIKKIMDLVLNESDLSCYDTIENYLKYILPKVNKNWSVNDSFWIDIEPRISKHQKMIKKAFARVILIDILETNIFKSKTALAISLRVNSIFSREFSINPFTAEGFITPTYSKDILNSKLIGYELLIKDFLNEEDKKEILSKFEEILQLMISENEIVDCKKEVQEYKKYILEKY